jgi:hypothetical protein
MNSIAELQNQQEQLKYLAAQRQLYSEAKKTLVLQVIVVIPVAVTLSFTALVFPKFQEWAALLGLLISLLDVIALESRQIKLVQQAALTQEAFDYDVLGLDWRGTKLYSRPRKETVIAYAERYRRGASGFLRLHDWYPVAVGQVRLAAARIICQRTNISWDSELRRRYSTGILAGLTILAAIVIGAGFSVGITLQKFVYAILAPLQPAFLWGIREYKKQRETADTLDRLMDEATQLFDKACEQSLTDDQLEQLSRALQNEIYDHRRTAPLIFDWVYGRLRRRNEDQMNKTAEELIEECRKKGASK